MYKMKVKWNNCFFCLNELENKTSDDIPLNTKLKTFKLMLKYLTVGGEPDKLNINEKILKLWTTQDDDSTTLVDLCDKCNDKINRFVKLQVELDVIQIKMIEIINQVRKVIIQNSKYCGELEDSNNLGRVGLHLFEDLLESQRREGEEETLKNGRMILETLYTFQEAVFKTESATIKNIPCIYLERFTKKSPLFPSPSPHQKDDKRIAIKIEPENLLTPWNPDNTFEENDSIDNLDNLDSPSMDLVKPEPNLSNGPVKSKKLKNVEQKRISSPKSRKSTRTRIPPTRKLKSQKKKITKPHAAPKKSFKAPNQVPRQKKRRSCDNCPFSTKSIFKFEFHLRKHEEEIALKSYSCAPCNLSISTQQYHDFHINSHQGHHKLQCDLCLKKVDLILLPQHMKDHLEEKTDNSDLKSSLKLFPCPNCSYCSSLREKYLDHLRDHHDKTGQYFCDICGMKVADRTKLLSHLYSEHNAIQKLPCGFDGCTMEYLDSFLLWNHQQKHKKQWICEFCGKACTSLSGLKVHERNHTGERPFPCSQCSETFKAKPDLNRHLINIHNGEKYQCQFCDKQYKDPVSLQNHMRIHDGSTLPCDQCGQAFVSKHQLKRHMIVHSTERNFSCNLCLKTFRSKGSLTTHMRTHTDPHNFKCSHCSKGFKRNQHLIDHLRTHTGERPFICDICGSSFTQAGPLINHKKKHL